MDNYQPVMSRLLILFPCSHMGNLLIALPHLRAMLAAQQDALLVVSQRYQALVEQSLPDETRLLYYPEQSLTRQTPLLQRARSYLQLVMTMRRFKAKVVVDIEGEQKSATLARLSGAGERIGPRRRHGQWLYTRQRQADWSGHRWQAYASLSCPAAKSPAHYLPLKDTVAGQDEANRILEGAHKSDTLIVIHAGATEPRQRGGLLLPLDIHRYLRVEAAHGHDQLQVTARALK